MLLLIDIGNTSTTIGFHDESGIRDILRLSTVRGKRGVREYSYILKGVIQEHDMEAPEGAVICSVVPEVTALFTGAIRKTFGIESLNVDHEIKTGLKFRIKNPGELGPDRIANAVAAHRLYEGSLIVVDFGTATTFCVVTEKGEYKGGAIMPGLVLTANSLAAATAKLPRVELKCPTRVLGRDTNENILAGVFYGHVGAVERIISGIKKEIGGELTVVATGGLSGLVAPHLKVIDHLNPLLTLEGLRFIYELNTEKV
ncbi:type III pantothenate kinase [bacterium BMS3Abin09]|nr:type III pantothenate kinase [bacterium BMS3Abin09]GBE41784.1 type III pantothenate kinase [bacterium BMS3Bbin09]HDH34794.1 type III pantothenate kinase [Nitrospirota bacterium]HDO66761.1 type III pantothenate kinase [Nitrospirota bacterium]HEW80935.1 type III pantothenate kinase [Nitrospirota bacterium]